MGSPARYACYEKEMLGWIREKMATQESATQESATQEVVGFLPTSPCVAGRDCSIAIGNGF
jgi:hypothetical protein